MSWKQEEGWNKPGDRPHRKPRDRGKTAPRKDDSGEISTWEASKKRSDKRRKRRSVTWIFAGVALAVLLLVAAAPTIASMFAPGIIASKTSEAIAGRVEVGSVSLGWFGSQRVERVRLYDDNDEQRGEISARADKGLLGLIFAGGRYGVVTLSGDIDLSTDGAGRAFLEHTVGVAPQAEETIEPAAPAEAVSLPPGLGLTLKLDDLRVTYADASTRSTVEKVRIEHLSGTIALNGPGPIEIDLGAAVQMKNTEDRVYQDAGRIKIKADVRDLLDEHGAVHASRVNGECKADLTDLATPLLDILPGLEGRGRRALGETVSLTLEAGGPSDSLGATLNVRAESITVDAPLTLDLTRGTLLSSGPITAGLDLDRLSLLMPDRDALFGPDADLHVTAYPRLDITIEDLSVPIPPGDTADLRGSGARLRAEIGALAAAVRAPGDGARRAVGFEPATVTINAADLAGEVSLRTDLNTTIDNKASGTLRVDLSAEGLLDDAGAVGLASPPTIRGEARAERLVLAAFQPIAAAAGFDLTGVIGQTADLTLTATPAEGEPGTTGIVLDAKADHASIAGAVSLDHRSVRSAGGGFTARFDRLDPLLAESLAASGLNLAGVSGATLRVTEFEIDLEAAGRGDLSGTRLVADAGLERLAGTLAETGEQFEAVGFTFHAEATPLSAGVHVTAGGGFRLNNADAGTLNADVRALGLLDEAGAMVGGLPSDLSGEISAGGVRSAALQPFLAATGLVLENDIGPKVDLRITASAETSGGAGGAIPPTSLGVSLSSAKLSATGGLKITADRIETTGEGLTLQLADAGGPLARFVPLGAGVTADGGASASVHLAPLAIPLDPATRRPDLPNASGSIRAALTNLTLRDPGGRTATVATISATTTLAPDTAPRIGLEGSVASEGKTGVVTGTLDILHAFDAFADDGRLVAKPVGSIAITDAPIGLLWLADVDVARKHAASIPLEDLAAGTLGPSFTITLTSQAEGVDLIALTLQASTPWNQLHAAATLAPTPAGGFEPRAVQANGRLAVAQPVVRRLLALRLSEQDAGVLIPVESGLFVSMFTDEQGRVNGRLKLEPTTIGGLKAAASTGGSRPLDPLTLQTETSFTVPLAALTDRDGAHAFSLTTTASGTTPDGAARVIDLEATVGVSLLALAPAGASNARVRLTASDTGWLDALSGSDGLLVQALGDRLRIDATLDADADPDGGMGNARAGVELDAPRFRTTGPIRLVSQQNTVVLAEPFEARWTMTPGLFDLLAPTEAGKAAQARLGDAVSFTLNAEELLVPLAGSTEQIKFRSTLIAPAVPLRFQDGTAYTYQNLRASLATLEEAGSASLRVSAVDAERPDTNAVDLNATVRGLPDGSADWSAQSLVLNGEFGLDRFPVRVLDAMALGQGDLVDLLGAGLDLDTRITDLPRQGGTFTLDATTGQANSRLRATVLPHPADKELLAVTLDEPMRTEMTEFRYNLIKKPIMLLPLFAYVNKKPEYESAYVNITELVAPVDGEIGLYIADSRIDPGVVDYDLHPLLKSILRAFGQRDQGMIGVRLQPFRVSMNEGVAAFDELVVPVGEFSVQARGKIDFVNQTEDIVLGIPAGAFADEVLSKLPGAGGALKGEVIVPVRRRGPLGQKNPWQPDFQAVLGDLFEGLIRGGLEDLLKRGKD